MGKVRMVVFGQIVLGPAGCGKSTYCAALQAHCASSHGMARRVMHVINLDPAAESFAYEPLADVRELVNVDEVAEEVELGPNGALVWAMEYLVDNLDWLTDIIQEQLVEGDYVLFDCPGQIELYTHYNIMRRITNALVELGMRLCSVFLIDSSYALEASKFMGGSLSAMSAMVQLELPHVSVLSKMDLLLRRPELSDSQTHADAGHVETKVADDSYRLARLFLHMMSSDVELDEPEMKLELELALRPALAVYQGKESTEEQSGFEKLHCAISDLLSETSIVQFYPLDLKQDEVIQDLIVQIDLIVQYDEVAELRIGDVEEKDPDEDV
ncbi:GPN-loop GTPase 3 [Porphyridium purpureum]|uniref:GPN-loop GTPase 3 n=1 Tax=Porphyridium purpureum TaxID=35688 RepID=A0A5J4YN34_PORPP|nr:GPN-loop GTPase 3 [Porphyridium purpureum]|eukprot:POR8368..scf244_11